MAMVRGSAGFLTVAALCVVVITGCASTAHDRHGRDSNLSDAAEQAKKKPDEQKKLPVHHDGDRSDEWRHPRSIPPVELPPDQDGRKSLNPPHDTTTEVSRYQVGAASGFAMFGGGVLRNAMLNGVQVGGYLDDFVRFDLAGYAQSFTFRSYPSLSGLKDPTGLSIDLSGRGYLTPKHTFMGVYGVAGIRYGYMWWYYRNPIQVIEHHETRTLRHDGLQMFGAYTGLGLSVMQIRHVHLGGNVIGGFQAYKNETSQGFDNDLIRPQGYVQLRIEMSYVWE
jgi:hypothetical protein